ncbi:MAG: phosphotransferase [Pseudomonadota bacterium]
MDRHQLLLQFLKQNNLENYQLEKVAGDASFRHYFRAIGDNKSFIIMDAPPQMEDVHPFCRIAEFLVEKNFSAPQIFAKDFQNGFLLLEDFGDDSYRKVVEKNHSSEEQIYIDAVDLLVDLRSITPPQNLPIYDHKLLLREVMLFVDWYLPNVAKKPLSAAQKQEFENIWLNLFSKLSAPNMLVLRDYHADNLMLLKNKTGVKKVGLLDFQDAVIGVGAYDLVSLLEDARRDVDMNLQEKMLQHYFKKSNCDEEQFWLDYQILSLQRNIKIIGIFSRLAFRDNKKNYLNFLPRVFGYVNSRLESQHFQAIKPFIINYA